MYQEYPIVAETTIESFFWIYVGVILFVIVSVLTLYGLSKMFKKASFNPIWAWIPFYNLYKLVELCGLSKVHVVLFFIPIINIVTLVSIAFELSERYDKKKGYSFLSLFFPYISYPILGLSNAKYVGINNKQIQGIYLEELKKEEVKAQEKSEVVKRDTNIKMGSNSASATTLESGELKTDLNILDQAKKVEVEYIECPNCHNKIKKGAAVCFYCGHKLDS